MNSNQLRGFTMITAVGIKIKRLETRYCTFVLTHFLHSSLIKYLIIARLLSLYSFLEHYSRKIYSRSLDSNANEGGLDLMKTFFKVSRPKTL